MLGTRLLCVVGIAILGHSLAEAAALESPPKCDPINEQCDDLDHCEPPTEQLTVPEDAVLVLGNTGVGKSTLTKLLAHEDEDMESIFTANQYLITGTRIGSSIASVTKVPGLLTDNATGTHFFDCPGFEDTRGSCTELGTTYYMKDITKRVRRVKVLLLAPYYAVTKGKDRSDFITMLLHAARILRTESKLEDSVALVVTKVDAFVRRRGQPQSAIPDDVVKQDIARFLQDEVLLFLQGKVKTAEPEEVEVYRRAIRLTEIFLHQSESLDYTRIGVFRAPDDEGRLGNITIIEDSRTELLALVHNKLSYVDVRPEDFGFSVSDHTKLYALTRSRTLETKISEKLTSLAAHLSKDAIRWSYDSTDMPSTVQRFSSSSQKISDLARKLKSSRDIKDFCIRTNKLDMELTPEVQQISDGVARDCQHFDVLQLVSEKVLVEPQVALSQWTAPLDKAAEELTARADWNRFLSAMYERLTAYDQQVKRNQIFVPKTIFALQEEATRIGLSMSESSALVANLTDLDALVARARQGPEMECVGNWDSERNKPADDNALVVRGEAVLLSEVVKLHASCPCDVIKVFALRVFVDDDVRLAGVSLAVVALRWEVLGSSKIILDGEAGQPWPLHTSADAGNRGVNGRPGRPGGPGGHFLGVGLEFFGEPLRVSASGGPGGPGQRGGDGGDGRSGGGNGGDGGHGGAGGLGGRPGTVRLFPGSTPAKLHFYSVVAEIGPQGVAGRGGLGGDHRPHTRRRKRLAGATILAVGAIAAVGAAYAIAKGNQTPPPPTYYDGARGIDGAVSFGQLSPDEPRPAPWADVPKRADVYLQHNLNHPYRRLQLRHFDIELDRAWDSLGLRDGQILGWRMIYIADDDIDMLEEYDDE